ncbi:MAG: DUF4824 family protein [Bryobacteraceae bacterium]
MKPGSLVAAAAVILVANTLALIHAARNRTGVPGAELTLTQRELRYLNPAPPNDDSGVTLYLERTDPTFFPWRSAESTTFWLDRQMLQQLGFDCSMDPSSPAAARHYQRQRPRQAFVALEYDGAAWRAWIENYERHVAQRPARAIGEYPIAGVSTRSHLLAVDADLDAAKLRARHPDRSAVVIVPAVIAVNLISIPVPGPNLNPKTTPRVTGIVQQFPNSIHVPRPFSDAFRHLKPSHGLEAAKGPFYRVHVRYGFLHEPWETGVEFTN